jgi:exopolyphosphatase / guanosine-5'-triphosphate,3'-diphosphate pyrophosphatase
MLELFRTHQEQVIVKRPVAIVDIGSNSVRLVVYDGLGRAPTPIFNEKVLCALGQGVMSTGQLSPVAMDKALAALRRFRVLLEIMDVEDIEVIATAATRDAKNGKAFVDAASEAIGKKVVRLTGEQEARQSALGVVSGFHAPDGIVADLGGGSLELIDVKGNRIGKGLTLPLGGLSLSDASNQSLKTATRIAREALAKVKLLDQLRGRTLYAVGGTWRSLAKLHMRQRNYMLSIMHGYVIPTREAADFAGLVERLNADALPAVEVITPARRPLLAYGAIVLDEMIRKSQPKEVVISASGVREGLLYERLQTADRKQDPLLVAARELNLISARAPQHAEDMCVWTDEFMRSSGINEMPEERRLRHAACLLADVNWRAHPDYRAEQSLNLVANAAFTGIDHPGRAFLALTTGYRYSGIEEDGNADLRALVSSRMLERARLIAAVMRVGYVISAAMPDILSRAPLVCARARLALTLPTDLADLASDRLNSRLKQVGRLIGREPAVVIAG